MKSTVIEDTQRLEELTEWCRNKPEEAAMRIMNSEGMAVPLQQRSTETLPYFLPGTTRATLNVSEYDAEWDKALKAKFNKRSTIDIEGVAFIGKATEEDGLGNIKFEMNKITKAEMP